MYNGFFVVRDEDRMKTVVDTSIMTYGYSMVTAEMRKFQQETENTVNRNMDALKQQLEQDRQVKDQLARDVKQLEDALRQMASRNQELEGQVLLSYKRSRKK